MDSALVCYAPAIIKIWRMGHSKDSILSMAAQNVYFYSLLCGSAHFISHYIEFGSVQCSRWEGVN